MTSFITLVFLCIFTIFIQDVILSKLGGHVYGCDGTNLKINCERGEIVSIEKAIYGRRSQLICGYAPNFKQHCLFKKRILHKLIQMCHTENSCVVPVSPEMFGDPCPSVQKYIEVKYKCVKGLMWRTMFYP